MHHTHEPADDRVPDQKLQEVGLPLPHQYAIDWCRSQHEVAWATRTGDEFEEYVTAALALFHEDFINPAPAGDLGDRKCDGLAESGALLYACYGSRPQPGSTESVIVNKIQSDFAGACRAWPSFVEWRFVTNARTGPNVAAAISALQRAYGPEAKRPIKVRLWSHPLRLWSEVISRLDDRRLDQLFPGRPGLVSPDLGDLEPLLDKLSDTPVPPEAAGAIGEVPLNKMDFNDLSAGTMFEFNEGRRLAPRIDNWYSEQGDPDLYDQHGARFREIYLEHSGVHVGRPSSEVVESIYVSLAGADFRRNARLANAVYTVTAHFFDGCHIFETPPEAGRTSAVAN